MAAEMGVSLRTLKRDVDFMRDTLNLPIEYDRCRHGFYYTRPVDKLPSLPMTEAEIFALLVAHKAIAQYHGTPFQKPLKMAFKKLTGQLDTKERYSLDNLGEALSFRPFAPEDTDLESFQTITRALRDRRALRFHYKNVGAKTAQERTVHPYHLACVDNLWYLFAFDVNRQAIRTFAMPRLSTPAILPDRFTMPKDFNPDEYLSGSFTVFKGKEDFDVVIQFDAWATDLLRGRLWHSTQELTDQPDGGSLLRLHLNSLEEIERWILSWGRHATVISPPALAARVKATAAEVASKY
jgi:proteasome accessory factor B